MRGDHEVLKSFSLFWVVPTAGLDFEVVRTYNKLTYLHSYILACLHTYADTYAHMGGYQTYGPYWGPCYNIARSI